MSEAGGVGQPRPADDDPITFLSSVTHAIDRLDPVAPELLDEFAARVPDLVDVVLPCLVAELERLSPLELILDDLQEITQARTLSALSFLLEVVAPGSQVVLATRTGTELWLARQRLSGNLLEIRADQLAFGIDETRALADSTGAQLSEEVFGLLCERTEGWPAGIALALHALPEPVSAEDIAQTITGEQREIADYLIEVMLDREPPERRRFLLATSVLAQMTAPLCDAILEVDNSSEVLAEMERTNSFVIALDDHGWYRYHTLFAELLRSELDQSDPQARRRIPCPCGQLVRTGRQRPGRGLPLRPRMRRPQTRRADRSCRHGGLRVRASSTLCGYGSSSAPTRSSRPIPNSPCQPPGFTCFWANPTRPNDSRKLPRMEISMYRPPTGRPRFDHRSRTSAPPWVLVGSIRCSPTPSLSARPSGREDPLALRRFRACRDCPIPSWSTGRCNRNLP